MDEADNVEVATSATEAPVSDRPDWLPEKFKTPEDMASSYSALESKLGQGQESMRAEIQKEFEEQRYANRPASVGEYLVPEQLDENLVNDNELFQWWANHAYEQGFSQEQFSEGIQKYAEFYASTQPDLDAEHRMLGENADARIEAVQLWVNKFFPDEMSDAVLQLGSTAQGIEALEHIMANTTQTQMASSSQPAQSMDEDHLRTMMKDPRYWNPAKRDPAYVRQVEEGFSKIYR
jgi:hypothetical protein